MSAPALAAGCRASAGALLAHLGSEVVREGQVQGRDFYGAAFGLWLSSILDQPDRLPGLEDTVRAAVPPEGGRYHTEFVLFALGMRMAHSGRPEHAETFRMVAARQPFARGRAANWRLLRASVRRMLGGRVNSGLAAVEVASVLAANTGREGFISDQRGRPSTQYHAFSCFLLGHLAEQGVPGCRAAFRRSVHALRDLALPSGEVNYLGRGALQSFGYASAVAALSLDYRLFEEERSLAVATAVLDRLVSFQQAGGRIPLVCSPHPGALDGEEPGWWSYNNHSDYAAFSGALLAHAAQLLSRSPLRPNAGAGSDPPSRRRGPVIPGTSMVQAGRGVAVMGPPRPGVAGGQPFPFVEIGGEHPLPVFGGEQDTSTRYAATTVPLPLLRRDGRLHSLGTELRWRWKGPELRGVGRLVRMARRFEPRPDGISVIDDLWALNDVEALVPLQLSLYRATAALRSEFEVVVGERVLLRCNVPLTWMPDRGLSPGGELCFLRAAQQRMRAGEQLRIRTDIVLR